MFNIAEYIQKYANIGNDLKFQKDVISKALKEVCGIENVGFEMKKGTLYIRTNPVMRSVVFMKKEKILEFLKENLPKMKVVDIR